MYHFDKWHQDIDLPWENPCGKMGVLLDHDVSTLLIKDPITPR